MKEKALGGPVSRSPIRREKKKGSFDHSLGKNSHHRGGKHLRWWEGKEKKLEKESALGTFKKGQGGSQTVTLGVRGNERGEPLGSPEKKDSVEIKQEDGGIKKGLEENIVPRKAARTKSLGGEPARGGEIPGKKSLEWKVEKKERSSGIALVEEKGSMHCS